MGLFKSRMEQLKTAWSYCIIFRVNPGTDQSHRELKWVRRCKRTWSGSPPIILAFTPGNQSVTRLASGRGERKGSGLSAQLTNNSTQKRAGTRAAMHPCMTLLKPPKPLACSKPRASILQPAMSVAMPPCKFACLATCPMSCPCSYKSDMDKGGFEPTRPHIPMGSPPNVKIH